MRVVARRGLTGRGLTGRGLTGRGLTGRGLTGRGLTQDDLTPAAPLHPILVHFTISLTSASLLTDVLGRVFGSRSLSDTGWWTLVGAAAATLLTLATGISSRLGLAMGEGEARSFLRLHMALGPAFFGILLVATVWRSAAWQHGMPPSWGYLAFVAGAALLMSVQGYLGGELVYRYGAHVRGDFRGLNEKQRDSVPPRSPVHPESAEV